MQRALGRKFSDSVAGASAFRSAARTVVVLWERHSALVPASESARDRICAHELRRRRASGRLGSRRQTVLRYC
jgi:hypothetical protein